MTTSSGAFWAGVRAEAPILLGTMPFGLIYGVLATGAGLSPLAAQAMSAIVFAGSAQFVVAQLVGVGTPPLVIIMTAAIINLRHALYSASLAPHLAPLRARWKWIIAYLLTDEAYAVTITHYAAPSDPAHKHWFAFGAGMALWTSWQASTAVGVFLGAQVPASWSLDFTLALTFIALVVPTLRDRATSAAALTAGVVAVAAWTLPFKLGLLLAVALGIAVGLALEALPKRTPDQMIDRTTPEEAEHV